MKQTTRAQPLAGRPPGSTAQPRSAEYRAVQARDYTGIDRQFKLLQAPFEGQSGTVHYTALPGRTYPGQMFFLRKLKR